MKTGRKTKAFQQSHRSHVKLNKRSNTWKVIGDSICLTFRKRQNHRDRKTDPLWGEGRLRELVTREYEATFCDNRPTLAGQPYALAKCMTTVILNRTNITACELDLHGLVLKVGRPIHWSYVWEVLCFLVPGVSGAVSVAPYVVLSCSHSLHIGLSSQQWALLILTLPGSL